MTAREMTADGGAIAERQAEQAAARRVYNAAEQEVIKHKGWFGRLLPPAEQGGIGAEPFTVAVLSQMQRTVTRRNGLMAAALNDPESLIYAATDCAARNLWPGEEYWFVPFDDRVRGTGLHTTGMPGWKGEVQQIYRSGMVEAVVAELVYEGDHFEWKPAKMRVPDHEPADVSHDPQFLRRVYVFAHLRGGGITHPVVLGQHQIDQARASSKAPKDFWDNPRWTDRMWLKTGLHYAYDRLPHSNAYNTQLIQAFDLAQSRFPSLMIDAADGSDMTALPPGLSVPEPVPGEVERPVPPGTPAPRNGGGGQEREHVTIAGRAEPPADPPPARPPAADPPPPGPDAPVGAATQGRLNKMFQDIGWSGKPAQSAGITREHRRVVTCLLATEGPPRIVASVGELTEAEVDRAIRAIQVLETAARHDGEDLSARLRGLYDDWQARQQAPAGDSDPGPDGPGQDQAGSEEQQ